MTLHLPRGIKWAVLNSAQAIHEGFVVNAEFLSEFHHSIVGVILDGKLFFSAVLIHFLPILHNDKKIQEFLYQTRVNFFISKEWCIVLILRQL